MSYNPNSNFSFKSHYPFQKWLLLSRVWLFETLCTVARLAPWSKGFPRQEQWSGLTLSFPGDLPDPAIKLKLYLLHCQADSFPLSHLGSPKTQRFHQRRWRNVRSATRCSQHVPWASPFGSVPVLDLFYLSLSLSGLKLPGFDTLFSGLILPEISLHLAEELLSQLLLNLQLSSTG